MNHQVLAPFGLSDQASSFLVDFYHVLQAWDDFYDGDQMPQAEKLSAIWASLVGIPMNPFFRANSGQILPLIASLVTKWEAANRLESKRSRLDIAFVWRAAYFDVVLHVVLIERGYDFAMEHGHLVASLYAETYETFKKEYQDA